MMSTSFIKIYIYPTLLISPFLTISMNSWFTIWMSMELNLMTFIPLMIHLNQYHKEMSMKYFIIQSFSSSLLMFSSNFFMIDPLNTTNNNFFYTMNFLMILSLMIKLGSAPFHLWYIIIMNNMSWSSCFILSTWQKIIPLFMLSYIYNMYMIIPFIISSSIIGAMFGLNHQSMRLILAYSSINHLSWMMLNLMIMDSMLMMYFLSYSIINLTIMMTCFKMNIMFINQIMYLKNKFNNFTLIFNFMSLASLPPMFGFMMKWYSISIINLNKYNFMLIIMIFMSLMTFIFYMRICITIMTLTKLNNKLYLMNIFYQNKKLIIYSMTMLSFLNLWIMNLWLL
nr:NADH deshydrogenase subunit 2 [Odontocolon albotibiale]